MVTPAIPAPNYGTLDNTQLGRTLGELPTDYARAQLLQLAQQQEQMQLDQQKKLQGAFAGGLPMDPNGQPNYSQIMQTLARAGDTGSIAKLAPAALEQQQYAPAPADQFLGGQGGGAPTAMPSGNVKGAILDQGEEAKYIIAAAKARGIDPDVALRVAKSEGLAQYAGDENSSFGPYQLHYGGVAGGGNSVSGLGDRFTAKTGLDARNPTTWKQQVDFALDTATKEGWGAWHGWTGPERAGLPGGEKYASASVNDATPRIPVSAAGGSALTRGGDSAAPGGAQPTGGASGSVATLFQGLSQNQQTNLAKVLGAPDVNAPLTPAQVTKAETLTQKNPALRGATQQTAQAGPAGAPGAGGAPLVYQPPLDRGFKTQQDEIAAEAQQIARLRSSPSKLAQQRAAALEADREERIKAITPIKEGRSMIEPGSGREIGRAPSSSPAEAVYESFIQDWKSKHGGQEPPPDEQMRFLQNERQPRSGPALIISKAMQEHPEWDAADIAKFSQDVHSQQSGLTKFTSGPQGNSIRSFNVLVDHLGVLSSAVDALKNKDLRMFNQASQFYATQTGNPAPTNFDATKAIVGDEVVKAVVGGGGALGDREEVKRAIDKANSPEQLYGVINQYRKLALGQLHGLQKQYETTTGREDFDNMLSPGTREFFAGKEGGAQSGGGGWTTLPNGARIREKP
jgi:hypothetical protein